MKISAKISWIIYFVLFILFFIAGIVFIIITSFQNLSEFNPLYTMLSGFSQLRYYELFLTLSLSSFICSVCFITIWVIARYNNLNNKVTAFFAILIAVLFCVTNSLAGFNAYKNFSEKGVCTDITKESEKPDEKYMPFFPYCDKIAECTNNIPYYSLDQYKMNGTILRTAQIFYDSADDDSDGITITVDYFESDKTYMMSKYNSEKYWYETTDELGNTLSPKDIVKNTYDGNDCLLIFLDTEKRCIIKGENFYYSAIVQDEANMLNINEKEFTSFAYQEFDLISTTDLYNGMPELDI